MVAALKMAPQGPLGTNTESSSPYGVPQKRNSEHNQGVRAARYALQNVIRSRFIAESDFDGDNPDWGIYNDLPRVVKCKRARVAATVGIHLDNQESRAHYSGLSACGSVWTCPICCAQIQEARRQEIVQAFSWAYANGFKVVMVTLTAPHYAWQSCGDLLESFASSMKYLRSGKRYQNFKKAIGFQGTIRALETRYGSNGWHNHTHELLIVDQEADSEMIRRFLLERWEAACQKNKLIPRGKLRDFRSHAVDVIDNMDSSDYLAKHDDSNNLAWGGDAEIAKPYAKKSKSLHPFQLADLAGKGDRNAWRLFKEYAEAFKGRASVFWSPGLKKLVGLDQEESDQEIAEKDPDESFQEVANLDLHAWNQVLQEKARALLLQIAENDGQPGIDAWLAKRGLHSVPSWYNGPNFTDKETRLVLLNYEPDD